MKKDALLTKAADAERESKYLDFKGSFDTGSNGEWCEVIKDIVAMANSGGGIIVFGVANDGTCTGFDKRAVLTYDQAKVTDKIARYTGRQFADFEIVEVSRDGHDVAALLINDSGLPMIFVKAGTYLGVDGKEKTAFQNGTIYVRHGAKSEPTTPDDLISIVEREVERRRKTWLRNIRKVVEASPDQDVLVVSRSEARGAGLTASIGRIVNASDAPGVYPVDADTVWPYRGKDLLKRMNQVLGVSPKVNTFDMQVIRAVYDLEKTHPDFVYRPFSRSSPQYSEAFIEWLLRQYERDPQFFERTREKYRSQQQG